MTKSINPSQLSSQTSHESLKVATQVLDKEMMPRRTLGDLLDAAWIEQVAQAHQAGDRRRRKVTCVSLVWILVLALGKGCEKLKLSTLAAIYSSRQSAGDEQKLSKNALSKQLRQRPWQYMRALVEGLMSLHGELFAQELGQTCAEWIRQILIVDETIMQLSIKLFQSYPASRSNQKKPRAAQKTEVCYHPASGLPDVLAIREERDNRVHSQFLRPAGEKAIYLFDLGYWWYTLLAEISQRSQQFVSRLRLDAAIKVEQVLVGCATWQGQSLKAADLMGYKSGQEIDLIVRLGSQSNQMAISLRLVGLLTAEGWRFWVTNLFDAQSWSVAMIADLYRVRWQIEILFRVLKSVLNIHQFVVSNENGFRLQIYAALLLYVLTRIVMLKAAQQSQQSLDVFSEVYALQVVSEALSLQAELLRKEQNVDWESLEQYLTNLIINQARRTNPKRLSQFAKFRQSARGA